MEPSFEISFLQNELDRANQLAEVCTLHGMVQAATVHRHTAEALSKQIGAQLAREQQPG